MPQALSDEPGAEPDQGGGALAAIEALFASAAAMAYVGEEVTMIQHQMQAGALAQAAGRPQALVIAALLHDVGHMIESDPHGVGATRALADGIDARHDVVGARWLAQWFDDDVTEPVRLHVAAKRFLVATEPAYADRLSDASVRTLGLQGGPMDRRETSEFRAHRHATSAVTLRRLDDDAKDPRCGAPSIVAHRDLILEVLAIAAARRRVKQP